MSKWTDEAKRFNSAMARSLLVGAKYVPAEKYAWKPAETAKSAAEILCEVVQGNFMLAAVLSGEQAAAGPGGCTAEGLSYEKAAELVEASTAAFNKAVDGWAEKDLTTTLALPWGKSLPVEAIIFLPGTHMNYHNGQLNYIQALLGDAEMHWE